VQASPAEAGHDTVARDYPLARDESRRDYFSDTLLVLIRGYKLLVSPYFYASCRFVPSCADYASEAVMRHGALAGGWLALKRLARCHPLFKGGLDLVPTRATKTRRHEEEPRRQATKTRRHEEDHITKPGATKTRNHEKEPRRRADTQSK